MSGAAGWTPPRVRDPLGLVRLYRRCADGVVAPRIRDLVAPSRSDRVLDPIGVAMAWGECPEARHTCFSGIESLPRGLPPAACPQANLRDVLLSASARLMRMGQPIAVALSGGLDSALVLALLRAAGASQLLLYTVASGFPGYDELERARATAAHFGLPMRVVEVGEHDFLSALPGCIVADPARLRAWIRSVLLDNVPVQVERLRAVVRDYRPSLIIIDPMMYAGAIVAESEQLPWAGLSTSLNPVVGDDMPSALLDTTRWLDADRKTLFAEHGLSGRFRVCDALSPLLNVCFSTPALVPSPPADVELMGPSLPGRQRGDECDFPWHRLDGRAVVMMSFGSQIYHQPHRFLAVIEAAASLGVQLVCSVGDLELGPLPDWVITVPYFPQLQMLERSAAFVTHGGANSVMEALAYGVPMLVSPICNDQFHNAEFVRRAGAGITLDLAQASVADIRKALRALQNDEAVRAATARVAASYRSRDGGKCAAERLMQWLS